MPQPSEPSPPPIDAGPVDPLALLPAAADLVELTHDSIIVRDPAGRILLWSHGAEATYGWSRDEALGQVAQVLLHTQFPAADESVEATLRREGRWEGELTQARRDGRPVVIASRQVLRQDARGEPVAIVEFNTDITSRYQAEAESQASEERLQRVIDTAVDGIAIVDRSGRITFANAAAEAIYGLTRTGLTGRAYNDPDFRALALDGRPLPPEDYAFARIMRTKAPVRGIEYLIEHPDGKRIILSIDAAPLYDPSGEISGVVACLRDVTERRQAEAQLEAQFRAAEQARSEARAILDSTSDAMILVSPEGRVLSVNRRVAELFGLDLGDLSARTWDSVCGLFEHLLGQASDARTLLAATATDREREFTQIVAQVAPERRELELFSTPVRDAYGEHIGRLYVFRDVTHQRAVDRMKSEFVSLVSHELRTPLTSIQGYVDLVLDGEAGELNEEQRDFLGVVQSNTRRLVALINDLLDLSRIESGRIELRRTPLDLRAIIETTSRSLRPQIEAKGQQLSLDLAGDLPLISADHDRLVQIITNLLSNAHKYTPPGGRLTITARRDGDTVQVGVHDTGIGLTSEEQDRLFTKFFRAQNRAVQEAGGTGLGLAITRSLVEMHGGAMTVSSVAGQGSTFAFSLPVQAGADLDTPREVRDAPRRSRARILVVDDEPDIARLIQRYLERAGYQVRIARTGAEAQTLAATERPDLITLDVILPDVDGFEVLDHLKSNPATATIPVILLSSLPDGPDGKLLGAVDYLTKPVAEKTLIDRVAQILADSRIQSVLVVDDDEGVRRLLAHHLRAAGYRVVEASDGIEAVDSARQECPGLVLMDIRMPRMDGIAALRALRANPATRDVPVIMMTASPGAYDESRSVIEMIGDVALLRKPWTAEELVQAIVRGVHGPA
ncbi:MAG TPA: response regulator [Dehalococcoidia bacterium]|nr:response regulator [Dehalococcoidia bacterium]